MSVTANQVRAARALLRLSTRELAKLSGLNQMTIVRFENDGSCNKITAQRLRQALEQRGVAFFRSCGVALMSDDGEV